MKPVIYIVGPTASGKTAVSVEVAKHFGAEIISADSMQIYKNMHIASAAPSEDEKQGIPHHLFEFLNPEENFSVSQYVNLANSVIKKIHSRGNIPIIVGGTGLYVSSLSENLSFGEESDKQSVRAALDERAEFEGLNELYEYLKLIDPVAAAKISPNDKKRILRAIEIFEISGKTKTEQDALSKQNGPVFENLFIGLGYNDREILYNRINNRVDSMIENGLVNEARLAYNTARGTAAQAIGHKEFFKYFDGEIPLEAAVEHLKTQTRHYAKRQLTWFRKNENINWVYMDADLNPIDTVIEIISDFLHK